MKLSVETKGKLRDMGASDPLDALAAQDEGMCMGMTCAERVQMAVDEAHPAFVTSKVKNLTRRAGLRYPEADVRSVDFSEECGLDRLLITELATCGFAERGQSVVLQGPTGTGKTHPACAIAKAACRRRMRACHIRCPDLEELWREARERPGGERKVTREYAAFQVLVLDEWLLDRPDELFRGFLLELMEARYGTASTVFCTQFRQKDWHARLGGASTPTPSWTASSTAPPGRAWAISENVKASASGATCVRCSSKPASTKQSRTPASSTSITSASSLMPRS